MITVRLRVDGESVGIEYASFGDCLADSGLQKLFSDRLVSECSVYQDALRITGLPSTSMTWERLRENLGSRGVRP